MPVESWVLDAGVAAKWYLEGEPLVREAIQVLRKFERGTAELLVPDLFWPEFGNVLWKASRQKRIGAADARQAIAGLAGIGIRTARSQPLLAEAFDIANLYDRTVYDAVYVALAVESGCPMLTADERVVNALEGRYPVRWLGSMAG